MNGEEEDSLDGEEDRYVLCTMPEVNDDRHDVGMNYVKAIYEEMTANRHGSCGIWSEDYQAIGKCQARGDRRGEGGTPEGV